MRRCHVCRKPLPDHINRCPRCMSNLAVGQNENRQNNADKILEPELVDPLSASQNTKESSSNNSDYQRFGNIFFSSVKDGGYQRNGCTPILITFGLAVGILVTYGFFAMLGFIFFSSIISIFTFLLTIRQLLNNRFLNPWILRILNWFLSWVLVAWLSGG